jgi:hypothetical protein
MLQARRSWDPVPTRWIFFILPNPSSITIGPGVDSASNRNEYQESSCGVKGGQRVRLTTLNFLNWYSGGWSPIVGPLSTAASNRPIVPPPGDDDDDDDGEIGGMMISRGNRSTWRKPAPLPLCPRQTPHALAGHEPEKPLTNCLSYSTAHKAENLTTINELTVPQNVGASMSPTRWAFMAYYSDSFYVV